jgi:hypothetical protein
MICRLQYHKWLMFWTRAKKKRNSTFSCNRERNCYWIRCFSFPPSKSFNTKIQQEIIDALPASLISSPYLLSFFLARYFSSPFFFFKFATSNYKICLWVLVPLVRSPFKYYRWFLYFSFTISCGGIVELNTSHIIKEKQFSVVWFALKRNETSKKRNGWITAKWDKTISAHYAAANTILWRAGIG